jgi:hypothetical protein
MDDRSNTRRPPAARHDPARYDRDLYRWAIEQAALLRAGRIAEADALNIAEELDDVGNEQYRRLQGALRVILLHLLKWDHQPTRRSRSWWSGITVQRNQVRRALDKNPGLKPQVGPAVAEAYDDARVQAAAQTRVDYRLLPERCPYSFEQIMERPIDWPPAD